MSLFLEGFGWSETFTLPLTPPPPPQPPSPLSAPAPGEEEAGGELGVTGRYQKPKVAESGVDTDAEIAAAVGGGGAMTMMNANIKPSPPPSLPAWAASQRRRWRKRLGGRRGAVGGGGGGGGGGGEERQGRQEAPAVSVVVEVGLKDAQDGGPGDGGLGRGILRVNAEVAFSACGRREVCVVWGCGMGYGAVVCRTLTVENRSIP